MLNKFLYYQGTFIQTNHFISYYLKFIERTNDSKREDTITTCIFLGTQDNFNLIWMQGL